MVFKLKTCKETQSIFEEVGASTHLQPFILCKIAISLAIRTNKPLVDYDFKTDCDGLELNRQTITGEYDDLFFALIMSVEKKQIAENDYFPKYLKAYIDKGAGLLLSEFKYSNSNFYKHLINLDKGI